MSQHLSPEQIDGWVIGERTQEVADHLQGCAACTDEVSRAGEPMALFGEAVRSWGAEQMSAARVVRPSSASPLHWWRMGLAIAALLLLIAVPVLRQRQAARDAAVVAARTAAQDEILLKQVAQAISQSVPAPMEPLAKLMPSDFSR